MPQLAAAHLPDAVVVDVLSNAAAAISAAAGEYDAAICAPIGVPRNGLTVLADKIADHADAVTRFALLSRPGPPAAADRRRRDLAGRLIRHDQVGALLAVLTELAVRGINLTRIESRPTGEQLGTYVFFLDCTGHVADRGSARRCRACAGSAPTSASSAATPGTAGLGAARAPGARPRRACPTRTSPTPPPGWPASAPANGLAPERRSAQPAIRVAS